MSKHNRRNMLRMPAPVGGPAVTGPPQMPQGRFITYLPCFVQYPVEGARVQPVADAVLKAFPDATEDQKEWTLGIIRAAIAQSYRTMRVEKVKFLTNAPIESPSDLFKLCEDYAVQCARNDGAEVVPNVVAIPGWISGVFQSQEQVEAINRLAAQKEYEAGKVCAGSSGQPAGEVERARMRNGRPYAEVCIRYLETGECPDHEKGEIPHDAVEPDPELYPKPKGVPRVDEDGMITTGYPREELEARAGAIIAAGEALGLTPEQISERLNPRAIEPTADALTQALPLGLPDGFTTAEAARASEAEALFECAGCDRAITIEDAESRGGLCSECHAKAGAPGPILVTE